MIIVSLKKILERPFIRGLINIYLSLLGLFEKFGLPVILFIIRFWMASIFWYSGLTKISSWSGTIYLFKDEYKVPVIPPEIAAYISTTFELSCPFFLVFGLATRLATLPLIGMTAVIQFTYLDIIDHRYWAMLLFLILFHGPGPISLDCWISRTFSSNKGK